VSPWLLNKYAVNIKKGAVFAYPTDTIWGLGCHPESQQAVSRILSVKKRPFDKGMILLSNCIDYCQHFIDQDYFQNHFSEISIAEKSPTTWLLPASPCCPKWLTGNNKTVAVRLTDLSHIQILCDRLGLPLISTSANISGRKPALNSLQIQRQFANSVDFIIAGITSGSQHASRIIDKRSGEIIRP
jgi:L-threonylcarbamoyladenylate synthase